MKHKKLSIIKATAFLIIGFTFLPPATLFPDEAYTLLRWAFIIKDTTSKKEYTVNDNKIFLTPTEEFKILIHSPEAAFIYLFHYSSDQTLTSLFPKKSEDVGNRPDEDLWIEIPPGPHRWHQLTPDQGIERFYLLASQKRLKKLESLTRILLKNPDDPAAQKKTYDEIQSAIKRNASFDPIENPVPISGIVKSDTIDIFEVKNASFYAKSIILLMEGNKSGREE